MGLGGSKVIFLKPPLGQATNTAVGESKGNGFLPATLQLWTRCDSQRGEALGPGPG